MEKVEVSHDYLFRVIGIQTVKAFALEEANERLIKEKEELQKLLKKDVEK